MEVGLLGTLAVTDDAGEKVTVPSAKQRALLASLALSAGLVVSAELLIDHLWSDDAPRDAANALRAHVSKLRRLLVPATMSLLGSANWWLPKWLDRILPHLDLEGGRTDADVIVLEPARELEAA
ncbi:MAG TPA: winged helix-turn-helix domain-containing protein [Acidimicrobiales bacterium]|jgi:DNA-binding SARP family transcriptional activator|nr:winged helix-turn-helix domain-containing protein [Acidimicrobiales bacterium]